MRVGLGRDLEVGFGHVEFEMPVRCRYWAVEGQQSSRVGEAGGLSAPGAAHSGLAWCDLVSTSCCSGACTRSSGEAWDSLRPSGPQFPISQGRGHPERGCKGLREIHIDQPEARFTLTSLRSTLCSLLALGSGPHGNWAFLP